MKKSGVKSILVSWLGYADLKGMASSLPQKMQAEIAQITKHKGDWPTGGMGPVQTCIGQMAFKKVYLLSNFPATINSQCAKHYGPQVEIIPVTLENPTDYKSIYQISLDALQAITQRESKSPLELSMLLSPGTPAMIAIWILLGKTKFPARFYQTFDGKVWETEIPFDLTLDVVPDLMKGSDALFQHLALQSPQEIPGFESIIGESYVIKMAVGRAKKAAIRNVSVLISGESGTGKEMFARAIHLASPRRDKLFEAVNCAALPTALLESQLFGHKKGAFTGADKDHIGLLKSLDGGTLFLDEIGESELVFQAKLLRALQPPAGYSATIREFFPVGAVKPVRSDVRIIAATNKNLLEAIKQGAFRDDLYYRLAALTIKLPPLRDRQADIVMMAEQFLKQINAEFQALDPGYKQKNISPSTKIFVKNHPWPGNVRQLYNVLLQAVILSDRDTIQKEDLIGALAEMPEAESDTGLLDHPLGESFSLKKVMSELEVHYLQRAMKEAGGKKTLAAKLLGMDNYQALDAKLKRLNIQY